MGDAGECAKRHAVGALRCMKGGGAWGIRVGHVWIVQMRPSPARTTIPKSLQKFARFAERALKTLDAHGAVSGERVRVSRIGDSQRQVQTYPWALVAVGMPEVLTCKSSSAHQELYQPACANFRLLRRVHHTSDREAPSSLWRLVAC
eukprot:scaffold21295_cov30-Tisochrysis_lutea.AAC.2